MSGLAEQFDYLFESAAGFESGIFKIQLQSLGTGGTAVLVEPKKYVGTVPIRTIFGEVATDLRNKRLRGFSPAALKWILVETDAAGSLNKVTPMRLSWDGERFFQRASWQAPEPSHQAQIA